MLSMLQGIAFDAAKREAWAHEHFQLGSKNVQDRLNKYLTLPNIVSQMPAGLQAAAQLPWVTQQAATEYGKWLDTLSQDLRHFDVASGHQPADTAAEHVRCFKDGNSNALKAWSDPAQAIPYVRSLLQHFCLTSVAFQTAEETIVHAVFYASDTGPPHTCSGASPTLQSESVCSQLQV